MSDQQIIEAIIAIAPGVYNSNLAFLSSAVWFFWDWVISIDAEVQLFWGKKLNTGSLLYFSNRILAVATLLVHFQTSVRPLSLAQSAEMCKPLVFSLLVLNGISGFIVQTVLVLRTYALWDCNKWVFWFLMGLNASATIAQQGLVFNIWGKHNFTVIGNPLPVPYTGCLVSFTKGTWERYIPILVFEFGVVFFLLVKFVDYIRQGRSNRVLYILFRDGFIEFSAVTVCSMLSLLIGIFDYDDSANLDLITFDLVSSISIICCARMLLNIRDVMKLSDPLDTTKPNPWSLDDSFDERYGGSSGSGGHTAGPQSETSQVDMFDTFFRSIQQPTSATNAADDQFDAFLPTVYDPDAPGDSGDAKGKEISREPVGLASGSHHEADKTLERMDRA
ncbi:hypothetical protein DL93DRAFT_2170130 [Clavulina sp. PMI_390]|nr:hypothetical protein DL93DRAFT_2170130 [Clavulina sp. PMI_390]